MLNLSLSLRTQLKTQFYISSPIIKEISFAQDGTKKLLISLFDKEIIESVIIPQGKRITVCISTQAGCKLGCNFCLTGKKGFRRNLYAYEIVDQILLIQNYLNKNISNIVLMGMGEPLDNYTNTIKALQTITSPKGIYFSPKRITLSTVGLLPQLNKLIKENLKIKIAISLNASNNALRNAIMPINKKYPLTQLIEYIRKFPLKPREKVTIEYVLIRGINDNHICAEQLALLLRGLKVKINLIPYNKNKYLPFLPSEASIIENFKNILNKHNYQVTIRHSKGSDILAACGQLGYNNSKNI